MSLTYAELFAGAGGLSMGLEAGGFHAVAHAEIEPHARAVLRRRWPGVRLDGDVTQINGADYAGVTLLSGGSPCQDLSVAGKRAGLEYALSDTARYRLCGNGVGSVCVAWIATRLAAAIKEQG